MRKPPGPDTLSLAYQAMQPEWLKVDTLLAGTASMRAAGSLYLPQHDRESNDAFAERLGRNVLLNMLQLTLDSWVGKPFSDPIKVSDDTPDNLKKFYDNVDLQGNNLDVFSRNWFKDGTAKAFSHVLVEFPRATERTDGKPRTLADDKADNLRPYLVHVKPENVLFAHCEYVDGVEVPTHVRILEEIVERKGWEEEMVTQIRVIEPGIGRVYRQVRDPRTRKVIWKLIEEYSYSLPFVPLVTFYADRQGFMQGKPPLADLADLNIAHWQSNSDQLAVLTVARFPILGVSGSVSEDEIKVGPNQWLWCPDPAGRFYYVEHTGKAIAAGRQHLLDLEETMAEYGAVFLKKRPGGASATARALDTAETTSPLQDMAIRFQSALQRVVDIMGAWIGLEADKTGTVTINQDFGLDHGQQTLLDQIANARKMRDLSRARYLKELHRLGALGDDFDPETNETELKTENAALAKEGVNSLGQPLPQPPTPNGKEGSGGTAKPAAAS